MRRRVRMVAARDLADVARLAVAAGRPLTVIFDADNTLVAQGVPVDVFSTQVSAAIARFERIEAVERVIVLTNGPERGVPGMIHRGNKPWTSRERLALTRDDAVMVVGDQILTDGILAWRLGATYVLLAIDVVDEAQRQAVMRRIGALVRKLFFHADPLPNGN